MSVTLLFLQNGQGLALAYNRHVTRHKGGPRCCIFLVSLRSLLRTSTVEMDWEPTWGNSVCGGHRYSEIQCFQLSFRNIAETVPETVPETGRPYNRCHAIVTAATSSKYASRPCSWHVDGCLRRGDDASSRQPQPRLHPPRPRARRMCGRLALLGE